jgi:hypothetical protein
MRKDTDLHSVRVGRGLIDMISKRYEEFQTKISDIEVEKWIKVTDAECTFFPMRSP